MKAHVTVVNPSLGVARAETENYLAVFFRLPSVGSVALSGDLDLERAYRYPSEIEAAF